MTSERPLSIVVRNHVAVVTLERPELMNRFDAELHTEFDRALDELHGMADVRAAVLASTGKVFSAGGDFDFILGVHADPHMLQRFVDEGRRIVMRLVSLPYPIIAAVQGPAVGLGATVALGCDMAVAARAARFADPHVTVGLVAGDGGCLVWPQAVGMNRAKRYLLTGDAMSAADAYQFGLVTDLVEEPEEVLPAATALAERIAALPPVAVQGTKRALSGVMTARAAEVVDLAFSYEQRSALSDDLVEAVAATRERRPGVYRGR